MEDQLIVADLVKHAGRRTSIRFTELQICTTLHSHSDRGFVGFYKLENGIVRASHGTHLHEKHCKTMSKCEHSAARFTHFLKSGLAEESRNQNEARGDQGLASATVCDTVIIADETFCKGEEIYCHGRNVFRSIQFRFPILSMETWSNSKQYLQVSCPTLKADDTLFTLHGAFVYDHIDIVSGICLFNGDVTKASVSESQDGGLDPSVLNTMPTIYEVEFIARSSRAIADVAAILVSRIRERRGTACVRIRLDVPCFHYYHSIVKKLERGICDSNTSLEWMDAVDLRHDQIAEVYVGFVQSQLELRGAVEGWEIHSSSKSNLISRSFRETLQQGECPRLEDVLQKLENENDELWRMFYRHVPAKERPGN